MQQCWKATSLVNDAVLTTRGLCQSREKATRRMSVRFVYKSNKFVFTIVL